MLPRIHAAWHGKEWRIWLSFFVPNEAVAVSQLCPGDPVPNIGTPSAPLSGITAGVSSVSKRDISIPGNKIISELDHKHKKSRKTHDWRL